MNQTGDKHEALNPPAVADILRSIELRAGYIMSGHGAYAEAEEIKRLCDRAFKGMRAWWHGSDKADSATSATEPKRIDPQYIGASVSGAWVKEWQDRADQLERELAAIKDECERLEQRAEDAVDTLNDEREEAALSSTVKVRLLLSDLPRRQPQDIVGDLDTEDGVQPPGVPADAAPTTAVRIVTGRIIQPDGIEDVCDQPYVAAQDALELERELAEANERIASLKQGWDRLQIANPTVPSSTKDTFPLDPTKAMIEAGAQRLVRWEDGSKWPDSWSSMDVRASRNDAERVWRSMWLEAEKNAAPQDSQADRNSSGSQPPEVPADAAPVESVKLQGDPQNANTSGTVRESAYVPAEQPVVASVGPIDAYAVRRAMQEFPAEYQTAGLLVTLKAAIRTYLACVTAAPSATEFTWTKSEARHLLAARTAIIEGDKDEAFHQIYWLVSDRAADPFNPWKEVEALVGVDRGSDG